MRRTLGAIALLPCLWLVGCASPTWPVPVHEQRLVSKPNMQFSRSAIYSYSSQLMRQIEPGLATAGGSQASTCTLCR